MNLESIVFAIIGAFLAYGALGCIVMLIRGLFLNDKESLSYRKYWHLLVGGFILCAGLSVSLLGQAYEDFFGKEDKIEKYNSNSPNFRGDARYGACNSGCGCKSYVSDGAGRCSNCRFYGCSTNKYGHRHY